MSRGLGTLQRAILDHLHSLEWQRFSIAELAEIHDVSERRMRAAVASLSRRDLLYADKEALRTERVRTRRGYQRPWRIEVTRKRTRDEWAALGATDPVEQAIATWPTPPPGRREQFSGAQTGAHSP